MRARFPLSQLHDELATAVKQHVPLDPARRPVVQVPRDVDGVLDRLLPLAQGRVLERGLESLFE